MAHNLVCRYIDGETGRRSDTPHHYIYNQAENSNLKVLDKHRVVKVIFEYVNSIFRDCLIKYFSGRIEAIVPLGLSMSVTLLVEQGA